MFELRRAEENFLRKHPEMKPLFRSGYLEAVFSDNNTIEIVPTEAAHRLGALTLSLYRKQGLI